MAWVLAPLLLLVFLSGSSSPLVHAGADHGDDYRIVAMSSLRPEPTCWGHRVIPPYNGSWVPLSRPMGPCSPLGAAAVASLNDLLRQDQLRVDDILKKLSGDVRDNKDDGDKPPADLEETQYNYDPTIKTKVGTQTPPPSDSTVPKTNTSNLWSSLPGVEQTVVLDTASDVPWVQCSPCPVPPCHPQTDTFYDPTRSPTYSAFRCNAPTCTRLGPYANGCLNGQCQYRVVYPDGSSSSGTYSSDRLTLDPTNAISNFQFGCSHAVRGTFNRRTAGIMALGGGPESLVSQASSTYGDAFSYCLPPTASYHGFFVLGTPRVASSRYVVTPLLRYKNVPTFYRVLLRAITVAGRRIDVAPSAFAAGAVMTSRTIVTRLPPTAYVALRAAFRNSMGMYRLAKPKGGLDTCYDFTGVGKVRLPRIELVFDGDAAVELDPSGVLFNDCLAFVPNRDDAMPGIIGNLQQQTIEVLYDVGGGAVGFRRNAC
ncbi:hypothetical protein HU200_056442 [Digitaria exilis]|uniref:Peptidase A1 domain-containing protein n=1 Tax=Digitaria exilis TaxID=1010633 RepID=A0A835E0W8_9POAL|nr:hypothetical protein HU200_056442 [Digitaria exilis]